MVLRAAWAVFKAYLASELLRSRGFLYGIMGLVVWMIFFMLPIALFAPPDTPPSVIAGYAFAAVLVFISYSMASWDWAFEIRDLMMRGILDYVLTSGRSIFILYIGVIPASLIWLSIALASVYLLFTVMLAPPAIAVHHAVELAAGLLIFAAVLLSYAMLLGGTTISTGTSGPVVEMLSWILPIATGGMVPLRNLPEIAQTIALLTPFSYPAELIRYGLLDVEPIEAPGRLVLVGGIYAAVFLALSLLYFRMQLQKLLREGPKTVGMY